MLPAILRMIVPAVSDDSGRRSDVHGAEDDPSNRPRLAHRRLPPGRYLLSVTDVASEIPIQSQMHRFGVFEASGFLGFYIGLSVTSWRRREPPPMRWNCSNAAFGGECTSGLRVDDPFDLCDECKSKEEVRTPPEPRWAHLLDRDDVLVLDTQTTGPRFTSLPARVAIPGGMNGCVSHSGGRLTSQVRASEQQPQLSVFHRRPGGQRPAISRWPMQGLKWTGRIGRGADFFRRFPEEYGSELFAVALPGLAGPRSNRRARNRWQVRSPIVSWIETRVVEGSVHPEPVGLVNSPCRRGIGTGGKSRYDLEPAFLRPRDIPNLRGHLGKILVLAEDHSHVKLTLASKTDNVQPKSKVDALLLLHVDLVACSVR